MYQSHNTLVARGLKHSITEELTLKTTEILDFLFKILDLEFMKGRVKEVKHESRIAWCLRQDLILNRGLGLHRGFGKIEEKCTEPILHKIQSFTNGNTSKKDMCHSTIIQPGHCTISRNRAPTAH